MKCKVYNIHYRPILWCEYDTIDCFIVIRKEVNELSDALIENAIDHPKGEIIIRAIKEFSRDEMEESENPKRVIYVDKFEDDEVEPS